MKIAELHPQEQDRIRSLRSLEILDTGPEKEFEGITQLASLVCDVPIALVSLVDESRQWFKSRQGLGATETPRDLAFCAHAILQGDLFEVPDTLLDERFVDNPLVTGEPRIRFYAGMPLNLRFESEELPLGTLCVIDRKPKQLTEPQKTMLRLLAAQVERHLQFRQSSLRLGVLNSELEFYRTTFSQLNEGIVLQAADGAIVDFNASALKILGLSADQMRGKTSFDPDWRAIKADGRPFPGEEHPSMVTLRTGESLSNVVMGVATRPENLRWISINSAPIFTSPPSQGTGSYPPESEAKPEPDIETPRQLTHVVSTFTDISDQRAAQAALVQSAKMQSLGEMAAGIAHEVNNPLAVISANSTLLRLILQAIAEGRETLRPEVVEDLTTKLDAIERTSLRIGKIVRGLRLYSREASQDPQEIVALDQIVEDAISFSRERFRHHGVDLQLESETWRALSVHGVPTLLVQVLVNLLNNSFDAILDRSERWIRITADRTEDSVRLSVIDSGTGIAPELRERIMQPFFTTKEVGRGTGLGLSISSGILEAHKGRLELDTSSPNTKFVIILPRVS